MRKQKTYKPLDRPEVKLRTKAYHVQSTYRHVSGIERNGITRWYVALPGICRTALKSEREAAICADKILIQRGESPVNILKKL